MNRFVYIPKQLILLVLVILLSSCVRPAPTLAPWYHPAGGTGGAALPPADFPTPTTTVPSLTPIAIHTVPTSGLPSLTPFQPATPNPAQPVVSPTPDPPRVLPTLRTEIETYTVQPGDALGVLAQRFQVSLRQLLNANPMVNPDLLYVGTVLTIPAPNPDAQGPAFKVIPDSELVYSPSTVGFDVAGFVTSQAGYLASYHEPVDDIPYSGADVINRIIREYSVNPRLLLALLEYQSGWVTQANPPDATRDYPLRLMDPAHKGLYRQLAWAADTLNRGFYLWRAQGATVWILSDSTVAPIDPTINAGTAGVQNLFAALLGDGDWQHAVGENGLYATYTSLFGDPFSYSIDPLLPAGLQQPTLQLPFEDGDSWSFTGGPHGGWGSGSAWAALDFAPPGTETGCFISGAWVVAMADGLILRSEGGAVVEDLDGDGSEQTGWTVLYMHLAANGRIPAGTVVHAGDRLGHASCEGGISNGTHTHVARRYNGEWIPADGSLPFVMDGWVSSGTGYEYDGYLTNNEQSIYAYNGRAEANQIWR